MSYRPKGKHVTIDIENPEALGICDYTGFVHLRKDLVKQMQWRGNKLIWTGFLVGKDYLDIPQEQLRPPMLKPDPIPVKLPRPQYVSGTTWNTNMMLFNLNQNFWNVQGILDDGISTLPGAQQLQALETYWWGAGA